MGRDQVYLGCSIGFFFGGGHKNSNILSYILMGYHIEASSRFFFQGGDQVYLGYSVHFLGGVRKTRYILSHLAGFKFVMVL